MNSNINFTVTGGTPPYSVSVKTVDQIERFISMADGKVYFNSIADNLPHTYNFEFTDADNCKFLATETLTCSSQPTCNNGNNKFRIISASYSNKIINFVFDANNLSGANWKVTKNGVIVINGIVNPSRSISLAK